MIHFFLISTSTTFLLRKRLIPHLHFDNFTLVVERAFPGDVSFFDVYQLAPYNMMRSYDPQKPDNLSWWPLILSSNHIVS